MLDVVGLFIKETEQCGFNVMDSRLFAALLQDADSGKCRLAVG